MTATLDHSLQRSVFIRAARATVFRYFTDSARFAAWWGKESTIDPRPGGRVFIRHPTGEVASGEVLEIEAGSRIVFTYGYDGPGRPIPPGASRVSISLEDAPRGTRVLLRHEFAEAGPRDEHVQGWRYQLALFANVVAAEEHAQAAALADAWFAAWCEPDAARRSAALAPIAASDVSFRDAYGCVIGLSELEAHLAAVHKFMPGSRLERHGDVRQCQGTALVDWIARRADGSELGRGTNVFELDPGGRIASVVGLAARVLS